MAKTAAIRARAESNLEAEAEAVLVELGLTPTQAITLLRREIVRERATPFPLRPRGPGPARNG